MLIRNCVASSNSIPQLSQIISVVRIMSCSLRQAVTSHCPKLSKPGTVSARLRIWLHSSGIAHNILYCACCLLKSGMPRSNKIYDRPCFSIHSRICPTATKSAYMTIHSLTGSWCAIIPAYLSIRSLSSISVALFIRFPPSAICVRFILTVSFTSVTMMTCPRY